ncbi:MAG TPA: CheR family methyltransferase [Blastocatellia bacterium]|nr:CheR family methyltransferase [Blastocatellia bacterium]
MSGNEKLSSELLDRFSRFIAEQMGLNFPPERHFELERSLNEIARAWNCRDVDECLRQILDTQLTQEQIEFLATYLTIGETYFFRENRVYEILERHILPPLIQARRNEEKRLRFWSAACATGEEPYSIAMMLHRLLPDLNDWNISLLATDINPTSLKKAAQGIYREWSFRRVPPEIKAQYFKEIKPGQFEIDARIKRLVKFSYLNLAEDGYPSLLAGTNAIDVILCRNVLLYFTPQRVAQTIERLRNCLIEGGWLAVSQTEVSHVHYSRFETVNFPDAILYRKKELSNASAQTFFPLVSLQPAVIETPQSFVWPEPNSVSDSVASEADFDHSTSEDVLPSPSINEDERRNNFVEDDAQEVAADLYERGDYRAAEEMLLNLVAEGTVPAAQLAMLARACANQGKLDEAAVWCEKAIAADKLNALYYYLQATIDQERGRLEEAKALLRQAIFLEPEFALAHFALGNIALSQNRLAEAERHYANVLRLLADCSEREMLLEGEGLTVGWLREMIRSVRIEKDAA